MYKKYGNKFMCFSPPVMLATLLIEFFLVFYTLWRYKLTNITRLVAAILIGLGVFQLSEYMICGGLGLTNIEWVKIGYISITILPALGIHLIASLANANKQTRPLVWAAYGTAAIYSIYFLTTGTVTTRECAPNYAIFDVRDIAANLYALYYYGWLLVAVVLAAVWSKKNKKAKHALAWMSLGYSAFIIPTTFVNLVDPSTIAAIPSIMCGFAVLLALVMVGRVLPLAKAPVNKRPTKKKRKS